MANDKQPSLFSTWDDTIIWVFCGYLLSHESDIAHGINDFGRLRNLFFAVFNREPRR
jgi:hypothetical protein